MTEQDMVERVADRLFTRWASRIQPVAVQAGDNEIYLWAEQDATTKAHWLDDARAAIEAMREPTEEMLAEGAEFVGQTVCLPLWRAMIDKALESK